MKKVLIDTDCGVDDAVAIMIALASSELEVLGLTTVNGNVGVEQVTENVLRLLPFLGREDIPVFRGASRPLIGQPRHAEGVHGSNGLGDVRLDDAGKRLENAGAPEGMLRLARENPGLSLVALGPLTNVAITLNRDAAVKMAHSEEEIRALGFRDSRAGKLLLDMHKPVFSYIEKVYGNRVAMFPDPLTMAYVVDPAIVKQVSAGNLTMELADTPRRGASVHRPGQRLKLVKEIDKAGFQSILLRIRNLA